MVRGVCVADLMWSGPEDIETWAVSPRGAGWLFGSKVTSEVRRSLGWAVPDDWFAVQPHQQSGAHLPGPPTCSRGLQVSVGGRGRGTPARSEGLQVSVGGCRYMFPNKDLVTVWSAPNYCYRCGGVAAIC